MTKDKGIVVQEGQCGLCVHFGEHHQESLPQLAQIRKTHHADEHLVEECGHPNNAPMHLKVDIVSGCDGFEPAV